MNEREKQGREMCECEGKERSGMLAVRQADVVLSIESGVVNVSVVISHERFAHFEIPSEH
jgi:hypothetical protein